ncbi:MAG: hypothetical protein ACTSUE_23015, partial [Promethearchaeota archaeon]
MSYEANLPHKKLEGIQWGILDSTAIQNIAVCEITNVKPQFCPPDCCEGTLSDRRMGPIETHITCPTCTNDREHCVGHCGYISLHKPLFHPLFMTYVRYILNKICLHCYVLREQHVHKDIPIEKCSRSSLKSLCWNCERILPTVKGTDKLTLHYPKISSSSYKKRLESENRLDMDTELDNEDNIATYTNEWTVHDKDPSIYGGVVTPSAYSIIKVLDNVSLELFHKLGWSQGAQHPRCLLIERNLLVIPNNVRPYNHHSGGWGEHPFTKKYSIIIRRNIELGNSIERNEPDHVIKSCVARLQNSVNELFDGNMKKGSKYASSNQQGLLQLVMKKEGMFRQRLLGKRVEYSGRSVITGDPTIRLDEIGVPKSMALQLTRRVTVTAFNLSQLKARVRNGPGTLDGATYVETPPNTNHGTTTRYDLSTTQVSLSRLTDMLHIGWTVDRPLQNGDLAIMNRQPTLHKGSIMAHYVRILNLDEDNSGTDDIKTLRLNPAVVGPYNADFDGDEMNIHIVQSQEAYAEALMLMHVNKNIVGAQSNRPTMAPIQDCLTAAYMLSQRNTFLNKSQCFDLMMQCDWNAIPIPAILIPNSNSDSGYTPYWTGSQMLSLVIPNSIDLETDSRGDPLDIVQHDDTIVTINDGELLTGTLSKATLGTKENSLIHNIVLANFNSGGEDAVTFISELQWLCNHWFQFQGFTVGLEDCVTVPSKIKQFQLETPEEETYDHYFQKACVAAKKPNNERSIMAYLNNARDARQFEVSNGMAQHNAFRVMRCSGGKGTPLNFTQISGLVGQQSLNGKRLPCTMNDGERFLPYFHVGDQSPEARGYVEHSFMQGLSLPEFIAHAVGGREGVTHTALKTADNGYLNRKLNTALGLVIIAYDGTVRLMDDIEDKKKEKRVSGTRSNPKDKAKHKHNDTVEVSNIIKNNRVVRKRVIQFQYGHDGMDACHFRRVWFLIPSLQNLVWFGTFPPNIQLTLEDLNLNLNPGHDDLHETLHQILENELEEMYLLRDEQE